MRPSANMFFARSASRAVTPSMSLSAPTVIDVNCTACTCQPSSEPSSIGLDSYPAFFRLRSVNASVSTISVPPFGRSRRLVLSAAGFIATRTSGWSPGVRMSWSAKFSWKPETPGSEPAGARISAGKSGNVARSLPAIAVSEVKRPPVNCMPSPGSPANRITTESSCSTGFATSASPLAPASAAIPSRRGGERGEPVQAAVREHLEAAEDEDEADQVAIAERVVQPVADDPGEVPGTLHDVPAVQPQDAPQVDPDARRQERRQSHCPADRRPGRARDDELNEEERREPERERGERERRQEDRVELAMLRSKVDEVGQHVRRVRQEHEPREADEQELDDRPAARICDDEQDGEDEWHPGEREVPDEIAVARLAECTVARHQERHAPGGCRQKRPEAEQGLRPHGSRVVE